MAVFVWGFGIGSRGYGFVCVYGCGLFVFFCISYFYLSKLNSF